MVAAAVAAAPDARKDIVAQLHSDGTARVSLDFRCALQDNFDAGWKVPGILFRHEMRNSSEYRNAAADGGGGGGGEEGNADNGDPSET